VVNARDATPAGGRIRVETYLCALAAGEAEGAEPGDYLCVSVHDTGEGMDAETAARVFEPFFTTKEPGRGTGLGLSQVYGFARQSGGAAAVDSTPGKGTTIRLYLPLLREDARPAEADAAPTARTGSADPAESEPSLFSDPETIALAMAFSRIQSPQVRRTLLAMTRAAASEAVSADAVADEGQAPTWLGQKGVGSPSAPMACA